MTAPLARGARAADPVLAEVLGGLAGTPKTLPPKLFYDTLGAELFERICELDEYYLTRTELSILRRHVGEIAALAGGRGDVRCALVEYGSGAGVKVRLLLDTFAALGTPLVAYVPIDISRAQLAAVAAQLAANYPDVPILPVCADYTAPLVIPDLPQRARRVAFFPGSTIGNFHPPEAAAFLRRVRRTLGPDGLLVLGADRRKDPTVLHAAYNDSSGVTAAFNLNMLARLNREYDADFDLGRFSHRAVWNDEASRVEMHLVSAVDQCVRVAGEPFHFALGETVWTESSYKYDRPRLEALASAAGFTIAKLWTDDREWFWVAALAVAAAPSTDADHG